MTNSGEVALLDCGQVKQLTSARRLALARLIQFINRWEKLDLQIKANQANSVYQSTPTLQQSTSEMIEEQKTLTKEIATGMANDGVEISEKAGDDCAVALALLLFGNSDAVLPGGYAGQELSPESPIAQVTNFPSEYILLGRATVMIKGIARRLNMEWGLSDRWAKYAREALDSTDPSESLPIWSVVNPDISTTLPNAASLQRNSKQTPIRFKDVVSSLKTWFGLLKVS